MAQLYEDHKTQGLMVVTLLVEVSDGTAPEVADLNEWVDEYGVTHPVVSDPEWEVVERYSERGTPALPAHTLLAPGLEIIKASEVVDEKSILSVLPVQ